MSSLFSEKNLFNTVRFNRVSDVDLSSTLRNLGCAFLFRLQNKKLLIVKDEKKASLFNTLEYQLLGLIYIYQPCSGWKAGLSTEPQRLCKLLFCGARYKCFSLCT